MKKINHELKLTLDGNKYCYLLGENLQSGIGGFGNYPSEALSEFAVLFFRELKNKPDDFSVQLVDFIYELLASEFGEENTNLFIGMDWNDYQELYYSLGEE